MSWWAVFHSSSLCSGLSALPRCHQERATAIQSYLHLLICDELVSVGQSLVPATPALLQAVATHVQTSHNAMKTCSAHEVPLKFVYGELHSMTYFSLQLEAMEIPNYSLVKLEDYYYLEPKPCPSSSTHQDLTPDLIGSHSDFCLPSSQELEQQQKYPSSSEPCEPVKRSRTPPPPQLVPPAARVHRRSMSSGYSYDLFPKGRVLSLQASACGSEVDGLSSGYEGGQSDDASSIPGLVSPSYSMATKSWMLLRVLPTSIHVYFQLRHCEGLEGVWSELGNVREQLIKVLKESCHRTNQWLLMKDMLETHTCSPYLLSGSASEAWVENVVEQQDETSKPFRAQEFMCDLVYSFHITPHWRIKDLRGTDSW